MLMFVFSPGCGCSDLDTGRQDFLLSSQKPWLCSVVLVAAPATSQQRLQKLQTAQCPSAALELQQFKYGKKQI
jgi:hypothetical protein